MGKFIDLTGRKFGRLTVINRANNQGVHARWNCKCDCGNTSVVVGQSLRTGVSKSCGCLHKEISRIRKTTHGMASSEEYEIWQGMIKRCTKPYNSVFKEYGGRGISVCDRWRKFENFYKDMGERPSGTSLDRIDNNGNYEPSNCRWATRTEQNRNQRTNRMISFQGRTQCLADWADEIGIPQQTLHSRLGKLKWSLERSLTTPAQKI